MGLICTVREGRAWTRQYAKDQFHGKVQLRFQREGTSSGRSTSTSGPSAYRAVLRSRHKSHLVLHSKKLRFAGFGHIQAVTNSELPKNAMNVVFDSLLGQAQASRNLFIG